MYFIFENTHKVWYANLWNWLSNWNLIIFDLLARPKGPCGGKNVLFTPPIHVSSSHTKFQWISFNGLGGDSNTDRRTDWWRRSQYPPAFFKKKSVGTCFTKNRNKMLIYLGWYCSWFQTHNSPLTWTHIGPHVNTISALVCTHIGSCVHPQGHKKFLS